MVLDRDEPAEIFGEVSAPQLERLVSMGRGAQDGSVSCEAEVEAAVTAVSD